MSSSDNTELAKKVALGAAIAAGALGVGYYLYSSQSSSGSSKAQPPVKLEDLSVLQLKEMGNKLFAAKKYKESIEVFTKAIERGDCGADNIQSMCFQNRAAAKEFLGNVSSAEIIDDCSNAISKNPQYGKAYVRRAKNLQKVGKHREALVDLFTATHHDPTQDAVIGTTLAALVEEVVTTEKAEWQSTIPSPRVTPVRHERVYSWLHKISVNDPVRKFIVDFSKEAESNFERAVVLLKERNYDSVPSCAEQEEGDHKLHALLLAARFYVYKNERSKAEALLEIFDREYALLIDPAKDESLLGAKWALLIEMCRDKESLMEKFNDAVAFDSTNADFYTTAAFRLTMLQEIETADELLRREGIPKSTNLSLMSLMLTILVAVSSQDMSAMHNGILALETFVNGMEQKLPYALSLLAKIYSLFQNPEGARAMLNELLDLEGDESIHWFDSGMLASSEAELVSGLEKCLQLEPHHAEANLMLCSLKVNNIGTRGLTAADFDFCWSCIERACEVIDGTPDFPSVDGVFRMRVILKAKREAGKICGI